MAAGPEGRLASRDPRLPVGHLLAMGAKLLASALWVSGREREEAWADSVAPRLGSRLAARTEAAVDAAAKVITLADPQSRVSRSAVCTGDQGAVIRTPDGEGPAFVPLALHPAPVAGALGEVRADERFAEAADLAFDDGSHTAAVVVVHRGEVVAERYAAGIRRDTQLESWSMGKSVVATLAGILVHEGALDPDAPVPLEEWHGPEDPRRAITVRHLLQMSSGLRFSGVEDWDPARSPVPDHVRVYMDALDVHGFCVAPPLEHEPGTVGRYRNCDPLALMAAMRRIVEARGESWLAWPQRALFDRIGVPRQVLETDRFGNFVITGFDYGTARGWAQLGLLHLGGGVAPSGRRLLPENWPAFVSSPAPAWSEPVYGGLLWLNRTSEWPLPDSAYYMGGDGTQRCFVVPSHDLVVVRLGHTAGATRAAGSLARALRGIIAACR